MSRRITALPGVDRVGPVLRPAAVPELRTGAVPISPPDVLVQDSTSRSSAPLHERSAAAARGEDVGSMGTMQVRLGTRG